MRRLTFFIGAVLVAACAGAPAGSLPSTSVATEQPIASSTATLAPTVISTPTPSSAEAEPSPSASDTAAGPTPDAPCPQNPGSSDGWPPAAPVTVNVDGLKVRDRPCLSGHLVEASGLTNPLQRGTLLITLGGPVSEDGYRWYAVGIDLGPGTTPTAGWVADGTTSDGWLRPASLACPEPTLAGIASLSPIRRLACYGSQSLTFTAHQAAMPPNVGIEEYCQASAEEPAWLVCLSFNFVNADGGVAPGPSSLRLYFDPATGIKPLGLAPVGTTGAAYEIRGHFNDRSAYMCGQPFVGDEVRSNEAELTCITEFVVEDLKPAT